VKEEEIELIQIEKELALCKPGICPYWDQACDAGRQSCAPHNGCCNSGVDEEGQVYCDRLRTALWGEE